MSKNCIETNLFGRRVECKGLAGYIQGGSATGTNIRHLNEKFPDGRREEICIIGQEKEEFFLGVLWEDGLMDRHGLSSVGTLFDIVSLTPLWKKSTTSVFPPGPKEKRNPQ